jgi:hypothetical protein
VTAREMVDRMPAKAREDMMEWYENKDAENLVRAMLAREIPLEKLLPEDPRLVITDASPFNEYFVLRRAFRFK